MLSAQGAVLVRPAADNDASASGHHPPSAEATGKEFAASQVLPAHMSLSRLVIAGMLSVSLMLPCPGCIAWLRGQPCKAP